MTTIAVAALSARALAEAAVRDGLGVIALDVFGDVDTQRVAEWKPIGEADTLAIDAERLLGALRELAQRGDVQGWVVGSGFDGRADLLERGAALLPLFGTAPTDVRRVRDPARFFGFLDARGIDHPAVQPAAGGPGWLVKDAAGCGGWHIRRAPSARPVAPGEYLQREVSGAAMSATFIANGGDAALLGFNEQIVAPLGGRPFVFHGVLGPVGVSDPVQRSVSAAVRAVAAEFHLRGLASLDFLLDGDNASVLEINPRAPASLALYPRPLLAHLRACIDGELPAPPPQDTVRGQRIVFAPHACVVDAAVSDRLARAGDVHDVPHPGTRVRAGDPLCSLSAEGHDAATVKTALARRCAAVLNTLETSS